MSALAVFADVSYTLQTWAIYGSYLINCYRSRNSNDIFTNFGREILDVNTKSIFYSCCTWLSFQINQSYYGKLHYIWCAPYFDPQSRLNPYNSVPPTSSPREIYWNLHKEVQAGDRHSAKIIQNRAGLQRGADIKLRIGAITSDQHREILEIVAAAEPRDFRPILYVIPGSPVAGMLRSVAVQDKAHVMSEEFIIETLPRHLFDAVEL